ncbi:hypothetical protein EW146_g8005 [Bondarzewia mesenterica]|uniref:Uncharacterized protein n=1 Tax=Bondarzewia mesenterica TaxID=1095465 RepID=A0A4S4LHN9_9AGAM|nr:hypothetical protein EW146_g8005 [Bondarzewia mesenterica]
MSSLNHSSPYSVMEKLQLTPRLLCGASSSVIGQPSDKNVSVTLDGGKAILQTRWGRLSQYLHDVSLSCSVVVNTHILECSRFSDFLAIDQFTAFHTQVPSRITHRTNARQNLLRSYAVSIPSQAGRIV